MKSLKTTLGGGSIHQTLSSELKGDNDSIWQLSEMKRFHGDGNINSLSTKRNLSVV